MKVRKAVVAFACGAVLLTSLAPSPAQTPP